MGSWRGYPRRVLEEDLLRKLESIEALFAGAKTDGEREAAGRARERIRQRLLEFEERDPPVEYRFSVSNPWSQRLLCALLRRYGVRPYRYPRQRQTTVMARISESFVETTLWPEFVELDTVLQTPPQPGRESDHRTGNPPRGVGRGRRDRRARLSDPYGVRLQVGQLRSSPVTACNHVGVTDPPGA